ncbi:MAG: O-antigen ligase family protein [Candidatus Moraniibacteriota bacterium]
MFSYIKQLTLSLNKTSIYLALANVFLVLTLIAANNLKLIPMRSGDFIFFSVLTLAFALYRPGWLFLFFSGSIVLENINLVPESFGIIVRPYQFFGGLLFLALVVRFFSEKKRLILPKFYWIDFLPFFIPLLALLPIISSPNKLAGLKLIIILVSFCILYLLTKIYIQDIFDLKKILPFVFGSSLVVMLYAFWQNMRFAKGLNSFAVMPGRPNGTLPEADWLGLYLLLLLGASYALIYYLTKYAKDAKKLGLIYVYLFLVFSALIISVSRSAWLGAIMMTTIYFLYVFTEFKFNYKTWQWRRIIRIKLSVLAVFLVSLFVVYFFHLTTFQLWNRAVSTGGMQKITISCQKNITLPEKISSLEELAQYGCRHINLEEIEAEKNQGKFVTEINRIDPNVSVRGEIYKKAWAEIKNHPIIGIGFENIAGVLGQDGRGANFNSSNIFLEIWLGSGIIGLVAFIFFLGYIFLNAVRNIWQARDPEKAVFALFILLSGLGIIIFNLFNAGLLLGIFWVWLGIGSMLKKNDSVEEVQKM